MKYSLKDFTIDEKIRLLNGNGLWHLNDANGKIKCVRVADGPSGVADRTEDNDEYSSATAMPNTLVVANTWDKDLAYLDGETIAQDCIEKDIDILLGPGVNIKRTPVCGRNFEYYSEDPFLAGTLAKEFIEGVQAQNVGTSLKHFCANNREEQRLYQSSEVDDRTLHEIYYKPFEIALKAKPWTVMCSYNPVNGVYASENKKLLNGVLRGEFGYDGLIVSDWQAAHCMYKCVKASLDLAMPYEKCQVENLKKAYEDGLITEEEIDRAVLNVLRLVEKTEQPKAAVKYDKKQRYDNAVKIARDGIVMLKNDGALPIKSGKVFLCNCDNPPLGGGGCAVVKTEFPMPPLKQVLSERSPQAEIKSFYATSKRHLLSEAYDADTVIFYASAAEEAENVDRTTLKLSFDAIEKIKELAKVNKKVVVVLFGGSAIDVSDWIDDVNAVLFCGFLGDASNEAIADVLSGKYSPCGKLSETFPINVENTPVGLYRGNGNNEWYKEGIFVGYRYYDKYGVPVAFPFGYGLSYAKFVYSDIKIEKKGETDYVVSFDVLNDSDTDASEISQIYVKDVFAAVERPEKELKGYSKNFIRAHEKVRVEVVLDKSSFAYYSTALGDWRVEEGAFEIMVGASSADIRLVQRIDVELSDPYRPTIISHFEK